MRLIISVFLLLAAIPSPASPQQSGPADQWTAIKASIDRNLGRPYVWGAVGLRSYDCSGFVWRVMQESGILFKRTTARKLFMMLPRAPEGKERAPGNIVFFSNLKHCGIANDDESFYHAIRSKGTTLSKYEPHWTRKISGYRSIPVQ